MSTSLSDITKKGGDLDTTQRGPAYEGKTRRLVVWNAAFQPHCIAIVGGEAVVSKACVGSSCLIKQMRTDRPSSCLRGHCLCRRLGLQRVGAVCSAQRSRLEFTVIRDALSLPLPTSKAEASPDVQRLGSRTERGCTGELCIPSQATHRLGHRCLILSTKGHVSMRGLNTSTSCMRGVPHWCRDCCCIGGWEQSSPVLVVAPKA
jgi:hypothetical protein